MIRAQRGSAALQRRRDGRPQAGQRGKGPADGVGAGDQAAVGADADAGDALEGGGVGGAGVGVGGGWGRVGGGVCVDRGRGGDRAGA